MTPRILFSASQSGWEHYENAIRAAGGEPIGGYCPAPDLSCDGLLLCGGGDIDPARFGQENNGSEPPDSARDAAEFALAEAFLSAGKPILGICRGHQLLNIALGGTLKQDVGDFLRPFHSRGDSPDDRVHTVRSQPDSLFCKLYGPLFAVNSSHHQALDALGKGFVPTLWSEGGIVEGMEHESLPILTVQFHPERMTGAKARPDTVDGAAIFDYFISLCRQTAHTFD